MIINNGTWITGECLEEMEKLPDKSIDLILCDLPYGTTKNKWDSVIPFELLWKQYWRLLKDERCIVLTASQPFTSALVMSQPKYFKHEWIWIKNKGSNFANTIREPFKEHESILVFSKGKWIYNKQMQERSELGKQRIKYDIKSNTSTENYNKFDPSFKLNYQQLRTPSSHQKFNVERGLHPTQKPIALFEYLIKTYTHEGMTVLDNCAGSGTTAIACENTNRKWICIEKDEKYSDIAKHRIKSHIQ